MTMVTARVTIYATIVQGHNAMDACLPTKFVMVDMIHCMSSFRGYVAKVWHWPFMLKLCQLLENPSLEADHSLHLILYLDPILLSVVLYLCQSSTLTLIEFVYIILRLNI